MQDTRNVVDEFKGKSHEGIVSELDRRGVKLQIAIENLTRDFNMGTIVRSANAFGVRRVHVIGRRQWNKRGAMMTDKYLHVYYHESVSSFVAAVKPKVIVAVDNVPGSTDIRGVARDDDAILVFGAEGPGLSDELLASADHTVSIPQRGSTRSLNVGVAAGIALWEWLRQDI
ncbi:MAG TPA: TrmH family RNA methyltransferase [Patescibacteria group bacterium]|nr:TrmH family RNA methyltransferase [Patescibacteria group bacterium]